MSAIVKLNLIAAASDNMGIGINGTLPWKLKNEMAYFTKMTTTVRDRCKKNAVVMGRRTWDCIPERYKPLENRVNIVLTRHIEVVRPRLPEGVLAFSELDEIISYVDSRPDIETAWIIGGASVYKEAMDHPFCYKIYLTEIQASFECDTFFPKIDPTRFKLITEPNVPTELQVEGDISYYFRVYQKIEHNLGNNHA